MLCLWQFLFGFARDADEPLRESAAPALWKLGPMGEVGEVGDTKDKCGDAPRRPMMQGSRWCSCGMALKRWVMSRAPCWTAAVARPVEAILNEKE